MDNTSKDKCSCPKCGDSQFTIPLVHDDNLTRLKCNTCGAEYYPWLDENMNPISILVTDFENYKKGQDNG